MKPLLTRQKRLRPRFVCAIGVLAIAIGALSVRGAVLASQGSRWSTPLQLNVEKGSLPDVVVGTQGDAHVFWGGGDQDVGAIFHTKVSDQRETIPVDILVSPQGGSATWPRAVPDRQGRIHLVWLGDVLYYSSAREDRAHEARAWASPQVLSTGQASSPNILLDSAGALHVVYTDIYHSPDVRHTYSEDGGTTWSQPGMISRPTEGAVAINVQLAIDHEDTLHVIWTETIEQFPPSGVYYSHSNDQGETWTEPYPMAEGGYSWGSVGADALGQVHLFWTGTGAWRGKFHCWSSDGGQTWTNPQIVWPGSAGFLGFGNLFTGSDGFLHLVAPASDPQADPLSSGEIFHSIWDDGRWTRPENLSVGVWDRRRENQMPSIAVSAAGDVHVVWQLANPDEPEAEPISLIWYTSRLYGDSDESQTPAIQPTEEPPEATATLPPDQPVVEDPVYSTVPQAISEGGSSLVPVLFVPSVLVSIIVVTTVFAAKSSARK